MYVYMRRPGQQNYHMTHLRRAGKSTTIFHIIKVRVPHTASVLLTAVRNAALHALLSKLVQSPELSQQIVIVGAAALSDGEASPYHFEHQLHRSGDRPRDAAFHAPLPAVSKGHSRIPGDYGEGKAWTWLNLAWLSFRAIQHTLRAARDVMRDVRSHPKPQPLIIRGHDP